MEMSDVGFRMSDVEIMQMYLVYR